MNKKQSVKLQQRNRRRARVRAVIQGSKERPRLNVFRSLAHMFVQIIDDQSGKTLASAHTKTTDVSGDADDRQGKIKQAYLIGKHIAMEAKKAGIQSVVFDRAGYKYHGRVKAVADGARDGGLVF